MQNQTAGSYVRILNSEFIEPQQQIARLDPAAGLDEDFGDLPGDFAVDGGFHLHGFEREQLLALGDLVAGFDGHGDDHARHRRADLLGVGGVGLGGLDAVGLQRLVDDGHIARLAVELEEDGARAVGMRLADRQELDDQRLARLDLDRDFLARLQAVEEDRRRQDAGVGVRLAGARRTPRRPWDRAGTRPLRGGSARGRSACATFSAAASKSAGGSAVAGRGR